METHRSDGKPNVFSMQNFPASTLVGYLMISIFQLQMKYLFPHHSSEF